MTEANQKDLYQSIQKEFGKLFALTMNYPKGGPTNACSFSQIADMVVVFMDTTPESHFVDSGLNCIKEFQKILLDAGVEPSSIIEKYTYLPADRQPKGAVTLIESFTIPSASVYGHPIKDLESSMTVFLSCSQEELTVIKKAHYSALYKKGQATLTKAHQDMTDLVGHFPEEDRDSFTKNLLNEQGWGKLSDFGISRPAFSCPQSSHCPTTPKRG